MTQKPVIRDLRRRRWQDLAEVTQARRHHEDLAANDELLGRLDRIAEQRAIEREHVTVGGVAALGTTAFLFLRASNLDDQANMNIDNRTWIDLHDQASTRRLAGAIIGVGGLALTATGIYLLATSRHQDRSRTASLDIRITGRGVVVFGRF